MYWKSTDNNTMSFGKSDLGLANLTLLLYLPEVFWEIKYYRYNEIPWFLFPGSYFSLSLLFSPEETIILDLVFNIHMNILCYYYSIYKAFNTPYIQYHK